MSDETDPDAVATPPDQAVLEESEHVVGLEDDRYLVSTSRIDPTTANRIKAAMAEEEEVEIVSQSPRDRLDEARVTIQSSLAGADARYVIEVTAAVEGTCYHDRIETDDVVEAFDELNSCFAAGVGRGSVDIVDVIDILIAESSLTQQRQSHGLDDVLEAYELTPEQPISELLDVVDDIG